MHQIYCARTHTHKHNCSKPKLSKGQREMRIAKKLFQKMFPHIRIVKVGTLGRLNSN